MNAINSPGLCPDPMPDDIQDELTQLRARVKELESDSITHLGIIGEKESRIRELEEAMRRMIGDHEPGSDCVATGPLTGTAMDYVCVFCTGKKILSDEKGRE